MFALAFLLGPLVVDARSLMQLRRHSAAIQAAATDVEDLKTGCADLKMEGNGTHYSIVVEVGTPGQPFAVVADTGSNSLIVPSCICSEQGSCDKENRCFRGTNKSSTFQLPGADTNHLEVTMVTFGSGSVQAVRANDMVKVGGMSTNMSDGVLLMTDQALQLSGPFEGILGLGLPGAGTLPQKITMGSDGSQMPEVMRAVPNHKRAEQANHQEEGMGGDMAAPDEMDDSMIPDWLKDLMPMGGAGDDAAASMNMPDGSGGSGPMNAGGKRQKRKKVQVFKPEHSPKSFLEQAKVDRFSMCFNNEGGGVLKLGEPPLEDAMQNIGVEHWGLEFMGISLGEKAWTNEVLFCGAGSNMTANQKTACGIIPDSGTTAIMGPEDQINVLMEGVCDGWSRCSDNHTALIRAAEAADKAAAKEYGFDPWDIKPVSKAQVFQTLLMDCAAWMDEDKGFEAEGLPDLHFHVGSADGKKKALKIPGVDYIMSMNEEDIDYVYKHVPGFGDVPVSANHTGRFQKVCSPSFGAMDYKTVQNGDVWILGVPLFNQYKVGYDLKAEVPSMSFTSLEDTECGTCKKETALVSETSVSQGLRGSAKSGAKKIRHISAPWRVPDFDKSLPL